MNPSARNPDGLADRLRRGTAEAHRHAERSPLITRLFQGEDGVAALGAFLAQLLPVYRVMESRLEASREDPVLAPLVLPELWRTAALQADVTALGASGYPLTEATRALVERVTHNSSAELVAHAYTRYLGDLSGGQAIGSAMVKRYGIDPLAFYRFDSIDDPDSYKHAYRDRLDALPVGDSIEAVVAEAILAFDLNRALMDSVLQLL